MKQIIPRSNCPLSFSLDLIGDKWSLIIIRDMLIFDKSTYGEFLKSDEKIATNILADRLSSLEQHGFITRRVSSENKTKVIYQLTEKSIDLAPIIIEHYLWGIKYNPDGNEILYQELKKDKQKTIQKFQDKIRANLMTMN